MDSDFELVCNKSDTRTEVETGEAVITSPQGLFSRSKCMDVTRATSSDVARGTVLGWSDCLCHCLLDEDGPLTQFTLKS